MMSAGPEPWNETPTRNSLHRQSRTGAIIDGPFFASQFRCFRTTVPHPWPLFPTSMAENVISSIATDLFGRLPGTETPGTPSVTLLALRFQFLFYHHKDSLERRASLIHNHFSNQPPLKPLSPACFDPLTVMM